MELRHLNTFKTIVDTGGFKKAADSLGYAQSSVTNHIKELENELGYLLFDRLGKQVVLTQAGKRFLPYALEIIELYAKSKEVVFNTDDLAGELTIGVSESLLLYWLPTFITNFTKTYPKVELTLKLIDYQHLTAQLKKGEIEAAILVESNQWQPKALTFEKIGSETLILVETADHAFRTIPETMLVTEYACSWRPIIDQYLSEKAQLNTKKIEFPSIEAIKKCVECGLGQSFLPQFAVRDALKGGTLKEVPIKTPVESIGIYAAYHKNKWISRKLEAFISALREQRDWFKDDNN